MNIVKIDSYEELLNLLLSQYANSDNLRGIIQGVLKNADDVETALFEVATEIYLFNAVGAQLDILGAVFGVSRDGRIDPVYRTAIQALAVLRYSGEPESIIKLVQTVFGATWVKYRHCTTGAKYYIYTDATGILASTLNPISPAGVQGFFEKPIVTGTGAYLVSAKSKLICSVIELQKVFLVNAEGVSIVDALGRNIVTIEFAE